MLKAKQEAFKNMQELAIKELDAVSSFEFLFRFVCVFACCSWLVLQGLVFLFFKLYSYSSSLTMSTYERTNEHTNQRTNE